jgi:hypothetical protein
MCVLGVKECPYHSAIFIGFDCVHVLPPVFIIFELDTRFELHSLFRGERGEREEEGEGCRKILCTGDRHYVPYTLLLIS